METKAREVAKKGFSQLVTPFTETFGLSWKLAAATVSLTLLVMAFAIFWFFYSAPPRTFTISSGPVGSTFESFATNYQSILKSNGVTLKIVPSQGSQENLERLSDPKSKVQVGFVQGGVTNGLTGTKLVSLGSITYEPLLLFYRGAPISLLSELKGRRLAIGPVGSGTRSLATMLLQLNGIDLKTNATVVDLESTNAVKDLEDGTVDAVFLMGDSASGQVMKQLLLASGVHIFNFAQADGYTRKITYLNKLELPMGSVDFGKNIPAEDLYLIGPTVEILARADFHPALTDLLLEAARQVHGGASLLKRKGEFPAPLEHDFPISVEAQRFYKSGKSYLYRALPFWLASLLNRILVAFVPTVVLLIPTLRAIPALYKWRVRMIMYRRYRALLTLERELGEEASPKQREALLKRLDQIEETVNGMKVPASFADQFYSLRGHIDFVRGRLTEEAGGK